MSGMYEGDDVVEFKDAWADGQTDKALCCYLDAEKPDVKTWVPFSMLHIDSDVSAPGDEGTLTVKRWWAEQVNLA